MNLKVNESLIIIGAGVSGLLSAAVLSKYFKHILVLEKSPYDVYLKQISARDRHAHVCVAGALEKYFKLLPEFQNILKENGFFTGDPGIDIRWSTVSTSLPKVITHSQSGYGSYKLFWQSIRKLLENKENIEVIYNVRDLKVNQSKNNLSYQIDSTEKNIDYNLLLVANGSPGRENTFLSENQIGYHTHTFTGYCCYHSFDIKLKEPLSKESSFISEAKPGIKDLSMLYVPRTSVEGILTVGNFGEPLQLNTTTQLIEAIKPWEKLIPADFISKVSEISKQTDFRSTEIWWHRLTDNSQCNIFLIGDAILRVPPYTGLGLAVAIESLEALIEHLALEQSGAKSDYNELFRTKANEIFIRLYRYEKQWGKQLPSKSKIARKALSFSISKIFSRKVSEFIFNEAEINRSPIAAKYLIMRFHLAQDSSLMALTGTLLRILISHLINSFGRTHEKLSKSPQ